MSVGPELSVIYHHNNQQYYDSSPLIISQHPTFRMQQGQGHQHLHRLHHQHPHPHQQQHHPQQPQPQYQQQQQRPFLYDQMINDQHNKQQLPNKQHSFSPPLSVASSSSTTNSSSSGSFYSALSSSPPPLSSAAAFSIHHATAAPSSSSPPPPSSSSPPPPPSSSSFTTTLTATITNNNNMRIKKKLPATFNAISTIHSIPSNMTQQQSQSKSAAATAWNFTWLVFMNEKWVPFDILNQTKLEQTLTVGGTFVDINDSHFPDVKRVRVFPKSNYLSYLGVKYRLSRIMQPDAYLDHVGVAEAKKPTLPLLPTADEGGDNRTRRAWEM